MHFYLSWCSAHKVSDTELGTMAGGRPLHRWDVNFRAAPLLCVWDLSPLISIITTSVGIMDRPTHTHTHTHTRSQHWMLPWAEYPAGWLSVCGRVHVCELSCVRLFATLWTVAHQAPLSMAFSRQEYWSGLPFPPPRHLPHPELMDINDALGAADPLIDQAPLLVLFHCRATERGSWGGGNIINPMTTSSPPSTLSPPTLGITDIPDIRIRQEVPCFPFLSWSPVMRNHASAWVGSSAEGKKLKFPCSLIWFWGWTAVMLQAQGNAANPMQVVGFRKIQERDYPRVVTQQGHNIQTSFPGRVPSPNSHESKHHTILGNSVNDAGNKPGTASRVLACACLRACPHVETEGESHPSKEN